MGDTRAELHGWKAIATHLGVSERTARNFEAQRGLPVHRREGGDKPRVFAYSNELHAWRVGLVSGTAAQPVPDGIPGKNVPEGLQGAFFGHMRHAVTACSLYGLLYAESAFLEVAYDFSQHRTLAWKLALASLLWIFATTLMALKQRSLTAGVVTLAASALALQVIVGPFLPARPVTQAYFQTYTAQAAFLKNSMIYFLPAALLFLLIPFHFVVTAQREIRCGRQAEVLRLLAGDRLALCPKGTVYLTLPWLCGLLIISLGLSFLLGGHLFDNLKATAGMNLFMHLAYGRALIWFSLVLWCLFWYYRALNELKRDSLAGMPAGDVVGNTQA